MSSVWAAPLDVTTGSLNFTLPPDVNPARYRSVVVWCPIIDSAYAAVIAAIYWFASYDPVHDTYDWAGTALLVAVAVALAALFAFVKDANVWVARPDGSHSGNPQVRAAIARREPQHMAWAYVRPDGGRVLFLRNVANVTMDLNDVEGIEFRALGGADNVTVGDLSGTDVTRIDGAQAGDGLGRRLVLHCEQGLGTTFPFARYAPILAHCEPLLIERVNNGEAVC